MDDLRRLHWTHPTIGEISEVVCPRHGSQVRAALRLLGIGSMTSDGSLPLAGYDGPGPLAECLRCAGASTPPRELLRQWFKAPQ